MKAKDLDYLRKITSELNLESPKLETIADKLQVSLRTLNNWRKANTTIPNAYVLLLRSIFEPILINKINEELRSITDQAYEIAPSQICLVRIVVDQNLELKKDTIRYQELCPNKGKSKKGTYLNQNTLIPIDEESMTTYCLQTGRSLNLCGEDILKHRSKNVKQLISSHRRETNTICHSLVHIPWCLPSKKGGGKPVALLTLENKLDKEKISVIEIVDSKGKTLKKLDINKDPVGRCRLYSLNEVDILQNLLRNAFCTNNNNQTDLFKICNALGYFDIYMNY
ncbi:hypothetical protein MHK_009658 [Candidatus Magnetomorum sp. HK-1]|nr:hypothetical protein MHK_009658 [Candidatus Magnetomorum sp. HK-1]